MRLVSSPTAKWLNILEDVGMPHSLRYKNLEFSRPFHITEAQFQSSRPC